MVQTGENAILHFDISAGSIFLRLRIQRFLGSLYSMANIQILNSRCSMADLRLKNFFFIFETLYFEVFKVVYFIMMNFEVEIKISVVILAPIS